MIYKEDITEFIKGIVDNLVFTINIKSAVDNLDGTYSIEVDEFYYLQTGFKISIGGNDYVVNSINYTTCTAIVTGVALIVATSFDLYPIKFFHGTIRETNTELSDYTVARDKTPMVYFYENFSEKFFEDNDNVLERESDLRLFFLTQADFQQWQTNQFYDFAIKPMRRLLELFIESLKLMGRAQEIDSYDTTNHTRFGVFITDKGYEKNYWQDNLSGCELRITLQIAKEMNCPESC